MQLQAAGAGLPASLAGLPPGFLNAAAAAGQMGQIPGLPPGMPVTTVASLLGGMPSAAAAVSAAAHLSAMRPSLPEMVRRDEEIMKSMLGP
jgi:precorrin isomerase